MRARGLVGILSLAIAIWLAALPAGAEKLPPVDNTSKAPGFAAFRQRLVSAIRTRDARFIESILARDIVFSFGGGNGVQGFRRNFRLSDPRSDFWPEIGKIVRLGGWYDEKEGVVSFPYFFQKWPEHTDALMNGVITGPKVAVHAAARASSPVLETLGYDIVALVGGRAKDWVKIKTPSGKVGFVAMSDIHSPGWRRAGFKRIQGQWRMTYYVEGD